jgi:hypothetical protein
MKINVPTVEQRDLIHVIDVSKIFHRKNYPLAMEDSVAIVITYLTKTINLPDGVRMLGLRDKSHKNPPHANFPEFRHA